MMMPKMSEYDSFSAPDWKAYSSRDVRSVTLEWTPELRQRIGKNPDSSLIGGLDEEGSQGADGRVQACGPRANGAWGQRLGAGTGARDIPAAAVRLAGGDAGGR